MSGSGKAAKGRYCSTPSADNQQALVFGCAEAAGPSSIRLAFVPAARYASSAWRRRAARAAGVSFDGCRLRAVSSS